MNYYISIKILFIHVLKLKNKLLYLIRLICFTKIVHNNFVYVIMKKIMHLTNLIKKNI